MVFLGFTVVARCAALPAKSDDIKAVYKDGVLKVSSGRAEGEKVEGRRRIVAH
ncbi:hypothetical protein [Nonomuraea sp. NPDC049400]|uniref:hypothetical protein n=1 Tax=Nonomuraea sp. NPDC049400 TaxID=3364352 RepID=UPI003795D991